MIWLLALVSCFGLICAEEPFRHNDRVIGGSDAEPNTWKTQVSLQFDSSGNRYFSHICGGSVISSFYIMTAAHCILSTDASHYQVVVGEYNLAEYEGSEEFISVKRIIVHPDWNGDLGNGNDIAILRLATPIYANGYVEIANLPYPDQMLPHGFTCYITGWGSMDHFGNSPDKLQQAPINIVEHAVCSKPEWWGSLALKTMVCAGGDGIISGCHGDSGGPLHCFSDDVWRVHGVVSYGPAGMCNQVSKPTVFTRVSSFIYWMYSVMNEN
ncbi:chymotrypsin-like elastase family member 2A [Nothobranchius furzeri]|uniref:Chymotrypsin-like elastase family member 2A n=1 Tax=Nothobranchius furzeri TaxID=105023 RepID=A0A8C6PF39_NOTFU|nr:chymotrypsin-like elastase family member 2A [Nothobranchius furzeri]KAF7213810.1 chymotrypsin-like elastase family member 2A [Nothobranchius furzeri]